MKKRLDVFEAHVVEPGRSARVGRSPRSETSDDVTLRHQDGALDRVIELPDVARPRVIDERLQRGGIEAGDALSVALRVAVRKCLRERRDVLAPFAQRREPDFNRVESEQQVLPETARGHFGMKIGVRRGDQPHVGLARPR